MRMQDLEKDDFQNIRQADQDSAGPIWVVAIPVREVAAGDVIRFEEGWLRINSIQNMGGSLLVWGGPNSESPRRPLSWSEKVDVQVEDYKPFPGKVGDRVATGDDGRLGTVLAIEQHADPPHGWSATVRYDDDPDHPLTTGVGYWVWPFDDKGPQPFDENDWIGLSGADTWPVDAPAKSRGEDQPIVRYGLNWFGVCDPHGLELYPHQGLPYMGYGPEINIEMQVPNQHVARLLLAGLPNELDWAAHSKIDYSHNWFV